MTAEQPGRGHHGEPTMREQILVAASDLYFEKGLQGTSMRDIAARVGVAQSSLYNHFPTKDALILAVMERSFDLVDGVLRCIFESGSPSLGLLCQALEAHALQHVHGIRETMVFEFDGRHMPAVARERVVALRGVYEARFYTLADELAREGLLASGETRTRMRFLLSAGVRIGTWFRPEGRLSADEVARQYAVFGLNALGAGEGTLARDR